MQDDLLFLQGHIHQYFSPLPLLEERTGINVDKEFKKLAKDKSVSENTIVFNNLINTIEELNDGWEIPASESWHSRFF